MRLHSPVPNILREVDNEFVLEGVRLASGTNITIAINLLHHNEEIWGDDVHVSLYLHLYLKIHLLFI